jgi:hypothetical protein
MSGTILDRIFVQASLRGIVQQDRRPGMIAVGVGLSHAFTAIIPQPVYPQRENFLIWKYPIQAGG